jgi:DNA-binding MarR family transcriptional regulator
VTSTTPESTTARPSPRFPRELVQSTPFMLKRLGFLARDLSVATYGELGLGPYHHAVLAVLAEGSRETQGAIADALGYDRGQLVGLLDELEERGLVERRRDPADRRRHIVAFTDAGRSALEDLRACAARVEEELLAPLGAEERAQLHGLLLKLAEEHLPHCAPAK